MIQLDLFLDNSIKEYDKFISDAWKKEYETKIPEDIKINLMESLINERADMMGLTTEQYKKNFLNE